ncbi:dienelactone hydrolase [Gaertneriomyces semiglobifer]|nr:dienelactone hydrolase [Gaertneriomyces semiglobifer]
MSNITYKGVPYFVAGEDGANAGLIVIQEWWGINDQLRGLCKRFANDLPCIAITPDLYRGVLAADADEANHQMTHLDWTRAVEDIRSAVEYLIKERGCKKVGITGFCMGGAVTLLASTKVETLSAGSCFYGIPSGFNPEDVKIPLQCHFGDLDDGKGFSDKEAADKLEAGLKAAGKSVEFHRYPNAGHAFMNETGQAYPYCPDAAALAFKRTVDFFRTKLQV